MGNLLCSDEVIAVKIYDIFPKNYRGNYSVKIKWKKNKVEHLHMSHEALFFKLISYTKNKEKLQFLESTREPYDIDTVRTELIQSYYELYGKSSIIYDEWITLDEAIKRLLGNYPYYTAIK